MRAPRPTVDSDARAETRVPSDTGRGDARAERPRARRDARAEGARRPSPHPRAPHSATTPDAAGARAGQATDARVTADSTSGGARADDAYALYAAYVEREEAEPDGALCASWIDVAHPATGRKARVPWRARMAGEIASGARVRPANLPGEIAALLPPAVRTRAPGKVPARAPERAEGGAPVATEERVEQRAPDGEDEAEEDAPVNGARSGEASGVPARDSGEESGRERAQPQVT